MKLKCGCVWGLINDERITVCPVHQSDQNGKTARCAGPCSSCYPGDHHWMEISLDPTNEDDVGHPALPEAADEAVMVWGCKHCDTWKPLSAMDPEECVEG